MLDILRKKASSWITKFLLGLVAVVFIFFFGYTGLQQSANKALVAASVNGDPIFQSEVNQIVQNQLELYRQVYKNEIPDPLLSQIRQNAVSSLIEDRIVRTAAEQLGLRVSNEEIYQKLSTDPNLTVNGVFDPENYRKVFRPWFLNRHGIDYEEILGREILKGKFTDLFDRSIIIADKELKNLTLLDRTKIRVKSIVFNPSKMAGENKVSEEEILKTITELWSHYSSGRSIAEKLEKNKLTEKESPWVKINEAASLFGGEFDAPAVSVLFRLTKKNSFPSSPLKVGNLIYFFKLLAREDPNPDEVQKNGDKEKHLREIKNRFYRRWYQAQMERAKIKIHEKQ